MTLNDATWLVLGLALGIALILYARNRGRSEKTILAIGLIVAALIYVGFALIWGDATWFFIELAGVPVYGMFYWLSVRFSFLWLAIGWVAHPVWDIFLHLKGPGHIVAPEWYAVACISFDILVAAYIVASISKWRTT
ncbi:MAG: DUF6010 family protein [Candidatus Thiodiazotropha sp.]